MPDMPQKNNPAQDWTPALPEEIPAPTYWPIALSVAATLIIWGLISSGILVAFGLALFFLSLGGWIQQIRNERRKHHQH